MENRSMKFACEDYGLIIRIYDKKLLLSGRLIAKLSLSTYIPDSIRIRRRIGRRGRNLEEIQWRFSRGTVFAIATTIEIGQQTTYTRLHLTKR